ncbi:transcriptional regulator [Streptomyces galilaeus]|uniref:transcriptional regulator n=1 Tax=Streptomyces galilaeus TaxID=33899 RepID=UPI0038F7C892
MITDSSSAASSGQRRHPLTILRLKAGWTHSEYARLVAETHAELGFGRMAARREKVSRWEAGRVVPERTAQLTIAHIHGVPEDEVLRRGWPDWLHLANSDARQLELPWTGSVVPEAILDAVAGRKEPHQEYLLATGWAARSLADTWLNAMGEELAQRPAALVPYCAGRVPKSRGGERNGFVLATLGRICALRRLGASLTAGWLVPALESELRHLADYISAAPEAAHRDRELLMVAAEALAACGFIARLQGDHTIAQRYYLAGLRCATVAADRQTAAAIMALHVGQYLDLQLHEEAADLLTAVRKVLGQQSSGTDPALEVFLHAQFARVHAQRGNDFGRRGALIAGRRALSRGRASGGLSVLPMASEDWLSLMHAVSLLDLNQPEHAIKYFQPVLSDQLSHLPLPAFARAMYLLQAAETQVRLGQVTAGATSAAKAETLLGGMRTAVAERVRLALQARSAFPEANRFLAADGGATPNWHPVVFQEELSERDEQGTLCSWLLVGGRAGPGGAGG